MFHFLLRDISLEKQQKKVSSSLADSRVDKTTATGPDDGGDAGRKSSARYRLILFFTLYFLSVRALHFSPSQFHLHNREYLLARE